uniref:ATP synthase CF1 delta subunit n=1 Tax=Rhodochaete parvula TaxID=110510 RepID=A0A1X9PUS7_9RHOD|nr:ATP synthase CF1 subunit delta [Rhodochaete parvula]ASK39652.1 ATP synthase CF1 delta subunit [Rhodochaete parvula]
MSNKSIIAKVSQPYAEALLEIAKNHNVVDDYNKDATLVLDTLKDSDVLKNSLSNPLISNLTKKEILQTIFSDQLSGNFLSFLMVLVDKKRIGIVETIIQKYLELAYKVSSVTVAQVSTAIPFSSHQHDLLISKLKLMTGTQDVQLIMNVDPELIGGFSIQIGSKVIDTSLRGQLNQMASCLDIVMS